MSGPQQARPSDADLPEFDPNKFKPGYTPPVVKKGEEEYNIIVSGVKVRQFRRLFHPIISNPFLVEPLLVFLYMRISFR